MYSRIQKILNRIPLIPSQRVFNMPPLSKQKKDKIAEQIIFYLFSLSPSSEFTSTIAKEIARDEEFVKSLLLDLAQRKLLVQINKNSKGQEYKRRQRWRLSNEAYTIYQRKQSKDHNNLYMPATIKE